MVGQPRRGCRRMMGTRVEGEGARSPLQASLPAPLLGLELVTSAFLCGHCVERFDDFFQFPALAFWALDFFCVVFLNGQHLAELFSTVAADVFVEWHGCLGDLRGGVRASAWQFVLLTGGGSQCFPQIAKKIPFFALKRTGGCPSS